MNRSNKLHLLPRSDRRLVLYARLANNDTWHGGFQAMQKAEHSGDVDAQNIVDEVYSSSTGRVPSHLDAFECDECGSVHRGLENAQNCCQYDPLAEIDERYEPQAEMTFVD